MSEVVDEVPVDPVAALVYAEGWQSWSPATWYAAGATGQAPQEPWQQLMRFRPGTPVAPTGVQGEGLLVVDPGNGEPARLFAAPDLVTIPTLRSELVGDRVVVRSTGPVATRSHDDGGVAALSAYGEDMGAAPTAAPPRVWCSWYRYFEDVTAAVVEENLDSIAGHDLAVDVVQVDDGWSPGLGEGLVETDAFGSLPALVDRIRGSGRRAGIWLAPFLVGAETTLAREHPDWLVGPAGRNWGQELVGLDLTNHAVRELLTGHLQRLVGLGVDYLKLDFLYAGAVPGRRHDGADPVAAYRSGLALVRDAVGPDVYLVGCGAPLLPSVGLIDAMRVSPDTFHEGGEDGSTGLRGLMPLAARGWQQGRLWVNDPDCVVARPSYSQRERWAEAARRYGGLRSFSDRISELDEWGLHTVRELLVDGGTASPLPADALRDAAAVAQAEAAL
jgi:alpha-galactosidase